MRCFRCRRNPLQPQTESMYELPHVTLNLTRAQSLLVAHVVSTWQQAQPEPARFCGLSVMDDVFRPTGNVTHV